MSHYTRPIRSHGTKLFTKESTHISLPCWSCGVQIIQKSNSFLGVRRKLCDDCKATLSTEQIKKIYSDRYKHIREQEQAKKTRPDNDRFIVNSPFRKKS